MDTPTSKFANEPLLQVPRKESAFSISSCTSLLDTNTLPFDDAPPSHVGSTTLFGASCNLCLSVLGAGQLTLPYALSQLGLPLGIITLVIFAWLSAHSLHTLAVHAMHYRPSHSQCIESYAEAVVRVFGPAGQTICTVIIAIYAWGGALSFLMILKGELQYVIVERLGLEVASGTWLMLAVAGLFIWPLSSLEDLSGLKRFSALGCAAAILITIIVLICAPWNGHSLVESCGGPAGTLKVPPEAGILLWEPTSFLGLAASFPLVAFAMNMSWAYVPILCTLERRTPTRVTSLITGASAIVLTNYLFIATFGYTTFCAVTNPNILVSLGAYVPKDTFRGHLVLFARTALAIQLSLALPMRFFVARKTIVGNDAGTLAYRLVVSAALVGIAAGLAALPLSLATVLGIVSSICATMIIYILPAIIDLWTQLPGVARKTMSAFSLLVGLFVMFAGLIANLFGVSAGA